MVAQVGREPPVLVNQDVDAGVIGLLSGVGVDGCDVAGETGGNLDGFPGDVPQLVMVVRIFGKILVHRGAFQIVDAAASS